MDDETGISTPKFRLPPLTASGSSPVDGSTVKSTPRAIYPRNPRCPATRLKFPAGTRIATGAVLYRQAAAAGHRRIGAVFHVDTEPHEDARFNAGIESARARHPETASIPALRCPPDGHGEFDVWLKRETPDCLIATVPEVRRWLAAGGHEAPETIGFLFWQVEPGNARWSGARQNDAEIGAAGIELLVSQIRRGERGTPEARARVLMESSPASGRTVTT